MQDFATGIDDIGTMNAKCSGWAVVSIQHSALDDFNAKAKAILEESGLPSFHGKEFKYKKGEYYVKFLQLIRKTIEDYPGFACCTLLGADWKAQFGKFCDTVVGNSFEEAGITSEEVIAASKRIAAPLFTYQRLADAHCHGHGSIVHIDRDAFLDAFNTEQVVVSGQEISSQLPIVAAVRAYGRKCFPGAPEIARESISVVPDEESFIVQAADIIGNFSTALARQRLGKSSKSNDRKCAVFLEAFGDLVSELQPPDSIALVGEDLVLASDAASFTFCIGAAGA